jgi:hypothetical protein
MAEKILQMDVEDAPQSAAPTDGSAKTKAVAVVWTAGLSQQALATTVQKLLHQIHVADPAGLA